MDLIDRNNTITSICQWLTTLERKNEYILTVAKMKQNIADIICEEPTVDAVPMSVIEEIKAEIDSYYLDCDFSVYDKDENCKKCNDNVFNSIRNIIDRKIKEIQA